MKSCDTIYPRLTVNDFDISHFLDVQTFNKYLLPDGFPNAIDERIFRISQYVMLNLFDEIHNSTFAK